MELDTLHLTLLSIAICLYLLGGWVTWCFAVSTALEQNRPFSPKGMIILSLVWPLIIFYILINTRKA